MLRPAATRQPTHVVPSQEDVRERPHRLGSTALLPLVLLASCRTPSPSRDDGRVQALLGVASRAALAVMPSPVAARPASAALWNEATSALVTGAWFDAVTERVLVEETEIPDCAVSSFLYPRHGCGIPPEGPAPGVIRRLVLRSLRTGAVVRQVRPPTREDSSRQPRRLIRVLDHREGRILAVGEDDRSLGVLDDHGALDGTIPLHIQPTSLQGRLIPGGRRLLVVTSFRRFDGGLAAAVELRDPAAADPLAARTYVHRPRAFARTVAHGMAASYWYGNCLSGNAEECASARPLLRQDWSLGRDQRIAVDVSNDGKLVAVVAFGALHVLRITASGLETVLTHEDVFYRDRDWFIIDPRPRLSLDARWVLVHGRSGLLRAIEVDTRRLVDVRDPVTTHHGYLFGRLPPDRSSLVILDPTDPDAVWHSHHGAPSRRRLPALDEEPLLFTRDGLVPASRSAEPDPEAPRELTGLTVTSHLVAIWTHGRIQVYSRPWLRLTGGVGAPLKLGMPSWASLRARLGVPDESD